MEQNEKKKGWARLWQYSNIEVVLSFVTIGALVLWGYLSHDPDFPIPDFFSLYVVGLIVIFLLTGLISNRTVRLNLLLGLLILPGVLLLSGEMWLKQSDMSMAGGRITMSEDRLLRYHYTPGSDSSIGLINSRWLNDREYEIPKPDGVFRIVILGDSVPNDGSVKQPFHVLLENSLNQSLKSVTSS